MKHGIELWGSRYHEVVARAREFRKAPTRSEAAVWSALRRRAFAGLKFRRQHPVGPFVVDFYCPACRLAVEVDGPVHETRTMRDALRQRLIEERGILFVRLSAAEVERDLEAALGKIRIVLEGRIPSHPCPASGAGAGG